MQIIGIEILYTGGKFTMGCKKKNKNKEQHKGEPAFHNDQLGENAGEGRFMKAEEDKKKR